MLAQVGSRYVKDIYIPGLLKDILMYKTLTGGTRHLVVLFKDSAHMRGRYHDHPRKAEA
jgi:hypothetical protein